MRLLATLACAMVVLASPALAAEIDTSGCAEAANVSWETDWADVTVIGAVVEVRGCEDGTPVGLQVLTDGGSVPAEALVSTVVDEHAHFDLEALGLRIEPVTGVRVLIYGEDTPVPHEGFEPTSPVPVDDSLALTGLNVLAVGFVALLLLSVGRRLTRVAR